MYAAVCVVALIVAIGLFYPVHFDVTTLEKRLLSGGPEPTLFSTVLPDRTWDTVCRLDPYDRPSSRLPEHMNEDLTGFTYEPSDQFIHEEESGLAFIDHESKTIYIYAIEKIGEGGDLSNTIYKMSGARCLKKNVASFIIEHVDGPYMSYTQLVFTSEK